MSVIAGTRPHRIGVIGESGVGKSTLLNALISERLPLLPQGGVGPLTAVPIEVRYAKDPYLRVACCGTAGIVQMLEACERMRADGPPIHETDATLVRLATLLAFGTQFSSAPLSEVGAFLRECCGGSSRGRRDGASAERIDLIRRLVATGDSGRHVVIQAGVDLPGLMNSLAAHGSGALAPVTASLELGWDAPILADGSILVDLPGLGVANDLYPLTTRATIASIQTVLLVVDRSGLTEAGARLLQRAFAPPGRGDLEGAEPERRLIVAVTKLDQVVSELTARGRADLGWEPACAAVASRMRELVRAQLESELRRRPSVEGSSLPRAANRAHVVAVFPLEYQRLHRGDPDEPARMARSSATGIPALIAHLRSRNPERPAQGG